DNDGTIDSYEENPVFIYSDTGWYSVNLTVYDEFDTNSFLRENYIYIDKTTGISKNKKFDIECYPNPFSEHITIQLPMYNRYKINVLEIYDISGKIIKTINTIENAITWNGKSNSGQKCNRGIYFLKLKNNSFIKKILLTN
ncbi:MAG: T9SS type A sorting domain-containing protein, partial [Bacteroidales bacterium]|nr:T9SS type A sorting domain-containing protein [Bacteroidales bacterium]